MVHLQLPKMSEEEATEFIISYLRRGDTNKHPFEDGFGFDLYIPDVISKYFDRQQQEWFQQNPQHGNVHFQADGVTNSQPFYNAAWNLCVRGILQPGVLSLEALPLS